MDVPWYANLPRVESRFYIEQYGGEDDVWIGKTLYRYIIIRIFIEFKIKKNKAHLIFFTDKFKFFKFTGPCLEIPMLTLEKFILFYKDNEKK